MKRAEILSAAEKCVCGQREQDYGTPENNFETIGLLWSVYLNASHPEYTKAFPLNGITAKDVAAMMSLLKIARIATSDNPDSYIDLAGYAACGGEIATAYAPTMQRNEETCVTCGATIPEGYQVCPDCMARVTGKPNGR